MSLLSSSSTLSGLKEDARHLAEQTVEAAREKVVAPSIDAARHAKERVVEPAVEAARGYARHTREFINEQGTRFERAAVDSRDRVSHWVVKNPFAALGVAFAAGLVCSTLLRGRDH